MTIWKYQLKRTDIQHIGMPSGAMVLHVGIQDSEITLWAAVDPVRPTVRRPFAVVGTGHPCPTPDEAEYHGTVFDGPFVWHIFGGDYYA